MAAPIPGYDELKLRIQRGPSDTYNLLAESEGGTASGSFALPFNATELENFVLRVGRPRRGVRSYRSSQMEDAKRFGAQLFDALIAEGIRDVYIAARGVAEQRDHGLRVTLYLTDVPELMHVPWEFLYERPSFLSQSAYTPIVRSLDLRSVRPPYRLTLPLRILGVVSQPRGFAELDVERERKKLEEALAIPRRSELIELHWLEGGTLRDLEVGLSGELGDVHVLHYIGHGCYDERVGSGVLVLEDDSGGAREVTGEELGSVLQDERSLRLVVLNACEGARSSRLDPFSGVASSLVEYQIPAVIGMQFEITDRAAITFATRFYGSLAARFPVDAALAQARKAIFAAENDVEFATPVLFLRATAAQLFDVEPVSVPGPPSQEQCEFSVQLEQQPSLSSPEEIAWQLTIANSGSCVLYAVTARRENGERLGEPVDLAAGRQHRIRWSEPLDPDIRRLITVTVRDDQGSSIAQQVRARPAGGLSAPPQTVGEPGFTGGRRAGPVWASFVVPAALQSVAQDLSLRDWVGRPGFALRDYYVTVDEARALIRQLQPQDQAFDPVLEQLVPVIAQALDTEGTLLTHTRASGYELTGGDEAWLEVCNAAAWEVLIRYVEALQNGDWVPA